MDYIYGVICQKAKNIEYSGSTTTSATTTITDKTISVDVVRPVPSFNQSTDTGKSLTVQSSGTVAWQQIIPTYSKSEDIGKKLTVLSDGTLGWQ